MLLSTSKYNPMRDSSIREGKTYTKYTADSIIYYTYEKFPPNGPTQYLMPVIKRILPRDGGYDYYPYHHPYYPRYPPVNYYDYGYYPSQYPYYYPQPQYPYYYPRRQYYPYPYRYPRYSRTFATNPNWGCQDANGKKQWGGQTDSGTGFGTGSTCASARRDFCNKYGRTCPTGQKICWGEKCPPAVLATGGIKAGSAPTLEQTKNKLSKRTDLQSGETVTPFGTPKGVANKPYSKDGSGNTVRSTSPSGCGNCKTNDIGCEFMKIGCEGQNWIKSGLGDLGDGLGGEFGKYLPYIAIGGVGIILLVVLLR